MRWLALKPKIRKFTQTLISLRNGLVALILSLVAGGVLGKEEYLVRQFREIDHDYLRIARQRINQVTRDHYGTTFKGELSQDLLLLQRLLDDQLVKPQQHELQQAMGVILGDLYRIEYPLDWVRYIDRDGASRALQLRHTAFYIFPITSISRRVSVGLDVDVGALYQKITADLATEYER